MVLAAEPGMALLNGRSSSAERQELSEERRWLLPNAARASALSISLTARVTELHDSTVANILLALHHCSHCPARIAAADDVAGLHASPCVAAASSP